MFRTASHNSKLSAHLSFFINNRELSLNSPPLEINSLEAKPTNEDLRVLMFFPTPRKVLLQQGQDGRHLQHQPSERKEKREGGSADEVGRSRQGEEGNCGSVVVLKSTTPKSSCIRLVPANDSMKGNWILRAITAFMN